MVKVVDSLCDPPIRNIPTSELQGRSWCNAFSLSIQTVCNNSDKYW